MEFNYDRFIDFINRQPANKEINHDPLWEESSAWSGCALGEFYTAETGKVMMLDDKETTDWPHLLHLENRIVAEALNCCTVHTYGALQELVA